MTKELFPLPAIVRPAEDLEAIATEINEQENAVAGGVLEHARAQGERLLKAKKLVGHGNWLAWLEENVRVKERQSQKYIRIRKKWEEVKSALSADLTINEVMDLLSQEDEDNPELALPDFVTLDKWNEAGKDMRKKLLAAKGDAKFNAQGDNENIEWALWSWNPITGCLHNCPYCYARDIAERFYDQKFAPSLWPGRLSAPHNTTFPEAKASEWMGHKNVFVCSMADLFGRWVPTEWIDAVLREVRAAPQWNFLFLTKFPIRMAEFDFPDNAWVGTTVDCQARVANAEKAFRKVKAGVKWLSCEPLIEPLVFADLSAFNWVVLGGASKSSQTPEWHPPRAWVNAIEDEALRLGVKVYEKTNLLERVRQYPGLVTEIPEQAPEPLRYLPGESK